MDTNGIRLIVGLGNPGKDYANTRHNVGAWFVEALAKQHHTSLKNESKFHAAVGNISVGQQKIWIAIPSTYMNESGRSVASLAKFYKLSPEQILIAHDELDFEEGLARVKVGGGHGGHNGLRDIIQKLGSSDFLRVRLGISHPGAKHQVTQHVLKPPSKKEKQLIDHAIDEALSVIDDLVVGDFERAMTWLHS